MLKKCGSRNKSCTVYITIFVTALSITLSHKIGKLNFIFAILIIEVLIENDH